MLLLDSISAVNFMLGWLALKSMCMLLMSVWLGLVNYEDVINITEILYNVVLV